MTLPDSHASQTHRFRRRSAALAAALLPLLALAPPALADGSLTYVKGGDVFVAAPDGSAEARLTTGGGFAWPSQADDGTVVAVRQTEEGGRTPRRLHRMDRRGTALNPPVQTVPVDNSFYIGPLAPKVSPDGRLVAYHYFYTGPITDSAKPRIALSHSDRDTPNGVITSTLGGYFTPSWLQDGRLLAFHAAERTSQVDIWSPDDSVVNWFADPEVAPLLVDGEVTRAADRLAAVGSEGELRLYALPGPPPAAPELRCVMTGFGGAPDDPTWSPDGRSLAWEEPDGIHVARLDDLAACGSAARPLVVAGGADPDWGVAGPNAGGGTPAGNDPPAGGAEGLRLSLAGVGRSAKLRAVLRKGLRVDARCSAACRVRATLTLRARTAHKLRVGQRIAVASGEGAAGRPVRLRLKVAGKAARRLRRARSVPTTLTVQAGDARVTRAVRLTR